MKDSVVPQERFFQANAGDLDAFKDITAALLDPAAVPNAAAIDQNVPLYDMADLRPALNDPAERRALLSESNWVLDQGPGVIALQGAYEDTSVIDRATGTFRDIIAKERETGDGKGDHFAASGANDRIWNSLQKHCFADPEGFALYYGNPAIAAACEAWLGPHYQMTAQVNQVRPGGQAQQAHRDYHLGFQRAEVSARYPISAHRVTAALTLQGAVAHCDMPLESGPTKLLPFSQLYEPGYLAFHEADHRAHFEDTYIQVPLRKGDALFFNPALFHAAGSNTSADIERMANLLQISSAFGRAMEAVDRHAMSLTVFPALVELSHGGRLDQTQIAAAIAATAEGYAFPTNLDTDPPVGGNAPASQADILRQAVAEGWAQAKLQEALGVLKDRRMP